MEIDTSGWSGEGSFTGILVESLRKFNEVAFLRVEDAPASRVETGYSFISNEVYVAFGVRERTQTGRRFGILPARRRVFEKTMTMVELESALAHLPEIGPADYADRAMIQYLRTERVVAPYQTRGYKLVELVRIYEAGVQPDASPVSR
jgi:hypothetical protein